MKTKLLITSAACVVVSMLISSCSNEENATSNGQLTAFTGGIVTEVPMERVQLGASEGSMVTPGFLTRTSMSRTEIGGEGTFFWEPNDEIYVEDDKGKLFKSQSNITGTTARTTFYVGGSYTAKTQYNVYYYGVNNQKVVIANFQNQAAFNDTKHFGAAGDCGVAKATKNTEPGKSGYKFDLEHKASYICFLPYIASQELRETYKIQEIDLTSDKKIAGIYDLTPEGLLKGKGEENTITLHTGVNGLFLGTDTKSNIEKSLYMVIAPGIHNIKVKYTLLDTKSNEVITITKKYGLHKFDANKIYDISVGLDATALNGGHKKTEGSEAIEESGAEFFYEGKNYYMWDAAENYWSGHEWAAGVTWQPTAINTESNNYPKSKEADPRRWYNDGSGVLEASNAHFQKLPNANEMAWYVMKGDAHWDNTTQWSIFGKTYTGGIWLKKLSVIAKENQKQLADLKNANPENIDMRTTYKSYERATILGKPNDSEISKYFFLPALGRYRHGVFEDLSYRGDYWTSTAYPTDKEHAYSLSSTSSYVDVGYGDRRYNGYIAQPFE